MPGIVVDRDRCKGCELCTHYCPMGILGMSKEINLKGYFFAEVRDPGRCLGGAKFTGSIDSRSQYGFSGYPDHGVFLQL